MGNKQTVFTHEQLEAYQVGMMDQAIGGFGSLVVFLAEEMGTASLHPGGVGGGAVSKRSWGGSVCGFRQRWFVGEEGGAPPPPPPASGRVWVKPTSLSTGLHLLHEKGNHEVSLRRKGRRAGHFLYALQFDCPQCLMGESCAQLVDACRDGKAAEKSHLVLLPHL